MVLYFFLQKYKERLTSQITKTMQASSLIRAFWPMIEIAMHDKSFPQL
jgi:hypothetical protein